MHEYSVVQALLEQCEMHAREHNATAITQIVVKIGRLSGIEPHLIEVAFDTFKEKTVCESAVLTIEHQSVVIECRDCEMQTTLEALHFLCPHCDSQNVRTVAGEEMLLMRLELEEG